MQTADRPVMALLRPLPLPLLVLIPARSLRELNEVISRPDLRPRLLAPAAVAVVPAQGRLVGEAPGSTLVAPGGRPVVVGPGCP